MTTEIDQATVEQCVGSAHGDLDRVRQLVERHPGLVNARARWNETPIEAAAQLGRKDIIEYLLSKGASLDFFTACVLGRRDVVEVELARDPARAQARGVHGLPSLYFAAIGGQPEIADLLLARGADVNDASQAAAPIHGAVMGRSAGMIAWLLEHGADPSMRDHEGRTAPELAQALNRPDLASLFTSSSRNAGS
ncbi:MAG TPA: ankyrin repeat domain-containing protein [Candidatus Dormibacteraeota bacterium]|nr:ankyrin repeat domain-containing protein [Candidatus Dormibacteraeota bacterium]